MNFTTRQSQPIDLFEEIKSLRITIHVLATQNANQTDEIKKLLEETKRLLEENKKLGIRVLELEERLGANSNNSSKSPCGE